MSKQWKPGKQTVALHGDARPSRIRREPLPAGQAEKKVKPYSREREMWIAVAGVVVFGIIIAVSIISFSVMTSSGDDSAAEAHATQFGACEGNPNCVIDGDTIRFAGATVAIAGMEAPSAINARCVAETERGVKAVETLTDLLNRGTVTIGPAVSEADGRVRRRVAVDGRDIAAAMIAAKVARPGGDGPENWCG